MTRRHKRYIYLVMLVFTIGFMVTGCVSVIVLGTENSMRARDIDGDSTLTHKPNGGLLGG